MLLDVSSEAWKLPRKSIKSTSKIHMNSPLEVNLGYGSLRTTFRAPKSTVALSWPMLAIIAGSCPAG